MTGEGSTNSAPLTSPRVSSNPLTDSIAFGFDPFALLAGRPCSPSVGALPYFPARLTRSPSLRMTSGATEPGLRLTLAVAVYLPLTGSQSANGEGA
jgi:hypothetical protein